MFTKYTYIHVLMLSKIPLRACLILILFIIPIIYFFHKRSVSVSCVIVCINKETLEIIGNKVNNIQLMAISVCVKWFVIGQEGLNLCNPGHGSGHLRGSDCKGARGVSHSLKVWTGLTNTSVEGGVAGLQGRQPSSRGQLFLAPTPHPPR